VGSIEAGSHAFVVRVWLEEGAHPAWRGHVTHVASGAHRYFAGLDEMVEFVRPYVLSLGTDAPVPEDPAEPA